MAFVVALSAVGWAQPQDTLDYEYFKTKVQPIFFAKRPGHARCVSCHASGTPLRLQPLAKGSTTWSEEDSRKNFDAVKRFVARSSYRVVPVDDEVVKSQQAIADRFAKLGLIPKPVNVSDIIWKWSPGS